MAKARALDQRRTLDPQYPQDHADDGTDRHCALQESHGPSRRGDGVHKAVTQLVSDLAKSGLEVSHPLLEPREKTQTAILLVLTGNRGLCGGYNSDVVRHAAVRWHELKADSSAC